MRACHLEDSRSKTTILRAIFDDANLVELAEWFGPLVAIPVAAFVVAKWSWKLCRWIGRMGPSLDYRRWLGGGFFDR